MYMIFCVSVIYTMQPFNYYVKFFFYNKQEAQRATVAHLRTMSA